MNLARHNAQMFEEGRSFSGNERDKLFLNRGDGTFADLSDLAGCDSPNDGRAVIACDFSGGNASRRLRSLIDVPPGMSNPVWPNS